MKERATQKKIEKKKLLQLEGKMAFATWVGNGRKVNGDDDYPLLNKKDAFAIVRVLLTQIDVKRVLKMGQLKTAKDCIKWLGEIGRGTTGIRNGNQCQHCSEPRWVFLVNEASPHT